MIDCGYDDCETCGRSAQARREKATREADRLEAFSRIREVLEAAGCSCECGHDSGGHDAECERCWACRVEAAMGGDE